MRTPAAPAGSRSSCACGGRPSAAGVVLIADVSGSMEAYSRAYLYLLHGSVKALRAETFVFATQLARLTRRLRVSTADPEQVLRAIADVEDWSGGARIGVAARSTTIGGDGRAAGPWS